MALFSFQFNFIVANDHTYCAAVQSRPSPVSSLCKQPLHPDSKDTHILKH